MANDVFTRIDTFLNEFLTGITEHIQELLSLGWDYSMVYLKPLLTFQMLLEELESRIAYSNTKLYWF
ncbi:hypothetical protein BBH51_01510 [Aggregatibacter actinomycetemcomitans]|uniref:Uncharacterized protein n=1 Tax=Aggregatibacter actinomycetemcomitans TaxID=714 RepID=A0A142G1B9_AGGAC|nr:hypothetical protein [Aggregatibacter actinomycetemcomitans]AFI87269.1 hypothetical protein D7S_01519 [Aggregatibacter actinomycetemcomitans D7S-1]EKX97723.1 hypothetical protein HMPREF9996_00739 [Aggregatibacter actinomycetemcomitans Y4]KND83049.1 hypothetical protein H5P1_0209745 [Aggregatibacter actinomycetemcomitans serotype a str. H5P1]KOE30854.1 hypothetical protein D17P3_0307470 [Aggregatibacter actinomycetemcomitans D17P-3]KOE64677.1 hypothetical protein I63B_0308185 [Aggregatibacte